MKKCKYCPNCGTKVNINSRFCTHCGHKFTNKPTVSTRPVSKSNNILLQFKKHWIVSLVILLVLLLCVGSIHHSHSTSNSNTTTNSTSQVGSAAYDHATHEANVISNNLDNASGIGINYYEDVHASGDHIDVNLSDDAKSDEVENAWAGIYDNGGKYSTPVKFICAGSVVGSGQANDSNIQINSTGN